MVIIIAVYDYYNYLQMKAIYLCGDKRVKIWEPNKSQLEYYDTSTICLNECRINEIVQVLPEKIDKSCSGVVLVFSLFFDFIEYSHDSSLPDCKGLLHAANNANVYSIVQQMEACTQKMKDLFPFLDVVWTIPSYIDFVEYNNIFVRLFDQEPLSEREIRSSLRSSKTFCGYMNSIKKHIAEFSSQIKALELHSVMSSLYDTNENFKANLSCSTSALLDGLHLVNADVISHLKEGIVQSLLDHKYIAMTDAEDATNSPSEQKITYHVDDITSEMHLESKDESQNMKLGSQISESLVKLLKVS